MGSICMTFKHTCTQYTLLLSALRKSVKPKRFDQLFSSKFSIFIKPNLSAWTNISQFTLETRSFRKYIIIITLERLNICSLLVPVPKYLLSHITTIELWKSGKVLYSYVDY